MRLLLAATLSLTTLAGDCSGTGDDVVTPSGGVGVNSPEAPPPPGPVPDDGRSEEDPGAAGANTQSEGVGGGVRFTSALRTFDDCDALLAHVRAETAGRVGPYGLDDGRGGRAFFGRDDAPPGVVPDGAGAETTESAAAAADPAGAGVEFSATNVQVTGVEEPDIVKTDGRRIVMVRDGTLTVVDVTGAEPTITGRVLLGQRWDSELLLRGNRVFVIGNYYGRIGPATAEGGWVTGAIDAEGFATAIDAGGAGTTFGDSARPDVPAGATAIDAGGAATAIDAGAAGTTFGNSVRPDVVAGATAIDAGGVAVSAEGAGGFWDRDLVVIDEVLLDGTPRRGRSVQVEGRYVGARVVDGTARVVVAHSNRLGFVHPPNAGGEAGDDDPRSAPEDWLGAYRAVSAEGTVLEERQALACDRVYVPAEFSGFGTLSVLTFDLDEPLSLGDGVAIFAGGGIVYAGGHNLYVATNTPLEAKIFEAHRRRDFEERDRTSIHKFSLRPGEPAVYVASGSVDGRLVDRFSLHDFDGHLFAAVTNSSSWGANRQSHSRIIALAQQGDALVAVGRTGDMGRGERIGAVRYIGDRAYVVTFAEVGALYVVDLSGPAEPAVRGELKIPGYSAYLHPIGDGLLAGVGRHATGDGRILGAKVSLFDISQAAGPREIDTWTLAGDAQSGTEWDHRSFLWWPPEQLMVLPVSAWGEQWGDEVSNRVAVFEITPAGGLDHRGYIDHSTTDRAFATDCHYEFDSEEREALDEGWNVPLLLACTPEQAGNPFGYHCKTIAATQAWGWSVDVDALKTDVGAHDRIQLCWPYEFENIDRTLIIGDNLWTLSRSLLQSNNLDTLQRRTRLVLRN